MPVRFVNYGYPLGGGRIEIWRLWICFVRRTIETELTFVWKKR